MDLLLLGAAAVVLIGLTLWIVWRPSPAAEGVLEASELPPQGNEFEDQYTSATADLSAAGVALSTATSPREVEPRTVAASPPVTTRAPEPVTTPTTETPPAALALPASPPQATTSSRAPRMIGIGAAALFTLAGAVGGAWAYARWANERNKPINRLRRRFR
jgi:hypothetical protein